MPMKNFCQRTYQRCILYYERGSHKSHKKLDGFLENWVKNNLIHFFFFYDWQVSVFWTVSVLFLHWFLSLWETVCLCSLCRLSLGITFPMHPLLLQGALELSLEDFYFSFWQWSSQNFWYFCQLLGTADFRALLLGIGTLLLIILSELPRHDLFKGRLYLDNKYP